MTTDTHPIFLPARSPQEVSTAIEARLRPLIPALLAYFRRRVEPADDAADCLSETLVVLWRHRARLPVDDDALRAYSYGIARHVLRNQRRGRLRRADLDERLRDQFTVEVAEMPARNEADDLLAVLGEKDRELVTLIVLDGLGVAEAGALLALRPSAARTRYARARARLRAALDA